MTLVQFFGFLNIFVGLFLTVAIILYGAACIVYFTRFGCPNRDESLELIEWALTILFLLIVILGIVQYFQSHPGAMMYIIGVVVFVFVVWFLFYAFRVVEKKPPPPMGPPRPAP